MAELIFVEHSGNQIPVAIEADKSLMQTALDNAVPGIDADCGGGCACGTCHVVFDSEGLAIVGEASAAEYSMLEMSPEITKTSRLACQIDVSESMDGLFIYLPEFQI